jgi:hypothetical protein
MRLFAVAEGIRRGFSIDEIHRRTAIDLFFSEETGASGQTEEAISQMQTLTMRC